MVITAQEMKKALQRSCEQVNEVNQSTGLAPIHYIALHNHTHTTQLLLTLLTYGNADIDARAADGKTALMLAVQVWLLCCIVQQSYLLW